MGQSLVSSVAGRSTRSKVSNRAADELRFSIFPTDLGWFGLWGQGHVVRGLTIGHSSAADVRGFLESPSRFDRAIRCIEHDWHTSLRRRLCDFARGIRIDFDDIEIELAAVTAFRQRVLRLTRKIPYGRTASYGDLAKRAGNPNAARAVGSAMKSNPVPILIPCHRVVASGGAIGGYSAPQGVGLKQRLLEMEAAHRSSCR